MCKISVITPVYKVEKYLKKCIDSILNQTFTDFELLIVDDGSPDNCGKIADEYEKKDSRVIAIHKENGGAPSARNAGILRAKGEYLYFPDSDDWLEPTYLEELFHINSRVVVFEAKYTKVLENLENECDMALQQMNDRIYAKEYEDEYDQILCYGISFFKKRCMVKKKN